MLDGGSNRGGEGGAGGGGAAGPAPGTLEEAAAATSMQARQRGRQVREEKRLQAVADGHALSSAELSALREKVQRRQLAATAEPAPEQPPSERQGYLSGPAI